MTGSARLDLYRRGADSLQGRYHHYRLHPFSHNEALARASSPLAVPLEELQIGRGSRDTLAALLRFGGFPEPFLAQSARTHRRWQKERLDRFFREDVRPEVADQRALAGLPRFKAALASRGIRLFRS